MSRAALVTASGSGTELSSFEENENADTFSLCGDRQSNHSFFLLATDCTSVTMRRALLSESDAAVDGATMLGS